MKCPSCGEPLDIELTRMGLVMHPTCPALEMDPELLAAELISEIKASITTRPRDLQKEIGPSEIGHVCPRRIGYQLADVPEVNKRAVEWKPFVGTSVHHEFEDIFAKLELKRFQDDPDAVPRWKVEERVVVGQIDGKKIVGHSDLFDAWHGAEWDWKFTTRTLLKHYKEFGPGDQYRRQGHLYGRGFQLAGHDVRSVGIIFWTRDGEFTDRYVWTEPYDEQVAIEALQRVEMIQFGLNTHGPEVMLPLLQPVESWCQYCPWFKRGETDLTKACPSVGKPADELEAVFS